jgi:uncharacterized protein YndB with AHSA1/START domain
MNMSDSIELVLTRTFDAPRALVWKLWTESAHLEQWWGPAGFGMKTASLDFRVGGRFHYGMTPPGSSQVMWGLFLYDEIHPEERLVFRSGFADALGAFIRNPFNDRWPLEIRNELTLVEDNGKTVMTLRGVPHQATPEEERLFAENRSNVNQGFAGTFAQLASYLDDALVADRAMVYRRVFDAPREVVWKSWTEPSKISAWFGPAGFGTTIKTMEVRPGGTWEFIMHGPDGVDYPNKVAYREVDPPRKLVYDQGNPNEPNTFRVSLVLNERDGKTEMHYRMLFASPEAKQLVIDKYGAAKGLTENMDRFAAWLSKPGMVLTRVFAAPRARVWKAWTEAAEIQKWWGPEHFSCPGATIDLRVGGKYLLGMRGPDGQEFWGTGEYREIVPLEKLVYTDNFSDPQGHVVPASSLGLPGDWPSQRLVTITFADLGGSKTLVTIHDAALPSAWNDMTVAGWSTSLDKLAKEILK